VQQELGLAGGSRFMARWGGMSRAALAIVIALCGLTCAESFKFVYIPCDSNVAMETWDLTPKNLDDHIGCLADRLQSWFSREGGLTGEQRAVFKEHIKIHAKEKNIQDAEKHLESGNPLIENLVSQETVEIVTLLPPMLEHGFISVCMYVDDKGMARQLPTNHRATSLMTTVTDRAGPVLGDAFVSRTYDNELEAFRRMDLTVADVSSSAGWVRICAGQKTRSLQRRGSLDATMHAIRDKKPLPPATVEDEARPPPRECQRKDMHPHSVLDQPKARCRCRCRCQSV
jgi:hypothetical protein